MDTYDEALVPAPFGMINTGSICYFNSVLQMMIGCTAFTKAVLANKEYMLKTPTGTEIFSLVSTYIAPMTPPLQLQLRVHSAKVLIALVRDLSTRRPSVVFGRGQESASEAISHILDMIEPSNISRHPITDIFQHRIRCTVTCAKCSAVVSTSTDTGITMNQFDDARSTDFTTAIQVQTTTVTDFRCPKCACPKCGNTDDESVLCSKCAAPRVLGTVVREYRLAMVPEVIICMFNIYGVRKINKFPQEFSLPHVSGSNMVYQIVGQVEHSGSLHGGHYWARGRREKNTVHQLNDTSTSPSAFTPTIGTYMIAYHLMSI